MLCEYLGLVGRQRVKVFTPASNDDLIGNDLDRFLNSFTKVLGHLLSVLNGVIENSGEPSCPFGGGSKCLSTGAGEELIDGSPRFVSLRSNSSPRSIAR